jgi:hypothetical protein
VVVWLALACAVAPAAGAGRFVARFDLRGGFVCVVAEGDLEPRSIGTFSVRVYRDLDVGDYVAGAIGRRDGFVRRAYAVARDDGGPQEIAVEVETAGSGRYSSTHVFVFDASTRALRARPSR